MPKAASYKLIGTHTEDLADGQVVAPGEVAQLSSEQQSDAHNKRLIDEGLLIPVDQPKSNDQGGGD